MVDALQIAFGLAGGLALFLYGMDGMCAALQAAAGSRLQGMLARLTGTPAAGALAGALATAVLQSSSAVTVMVIGFASAGLMKLPQAISVIFGANVGTTITAQLTAFNIGSYIYLMIFVGYAAQAAAKNAQVRCIGRVLFHFGLLFEGIEIMGSVMQPLAGSAAFMGLLRRVMGAPLPGILLGTGMTVLVQSSSAAIAVVQRLAVQLGGAARLEGLIPILLGNNIGTTVTALLAAIGQQPNARRAALAHSIFNISGSAVFACITPQFARFIEHITPGGAQEISRQIANAHTCFNLASALLWLPLLPVMVKIVQALIPGTKAPANSAAAPSAQ